jgi:hypothetical protein
MTTDALIKVGRPDTSCARACYVGRYYSFAFVVVSVFVVASWFYWYKLFVVAYPTVFLSNVLENVVHLSPISFMDRPMGIMWCIPTIQGDQKVSVHLIARYTFRMCSVMTIFKSSIVWGLFEYTEYRKRQVHRDFLVTLYFTTITLKGNLSNWPT